MVAEEDRIQEEKLLFLAGDFGASKNCARVRAPCSQRAMLIRRARGFLEKSRCSGANGAARESESDIRETFSLSNLF